MSFSKTFVIIIIVVIITSNFTDSRDNNTYSIFKVENKVWLKENLKYIFKDSTNKSFKLKNYYDKYGAYYTLESAKKACPKGFQLPSLKDYKMIIDKMKGLKNQRNGKLVDKEELDKYGFLLGGLTKGTKVGLGNSMGFYWTKSDSLMPYHKTPKEGNKRHLIGIHIYKEKGSKLYNIEPTFMLAKKYSKMAMSCKCVEE